MNFANSNYTFHRQTSILFIKTAIRCNILSENPYFCRCSPLNSHHFCRQRHTKFTITVQEASTRDALAKSQQEVVLKADFLGFGNSRQTMTAEYKEGEYFLVGTAEHQIIVRGTNYIQAPSMG